MLPATMVAAPYAATNPSWSATRGASSGSGVWIALVLGAAGIIVAAAVVILFLAVHARPVSSSTATQPIEPERTAAPVVTTPVQPVEIAPLHPLGASTTQQQSAPPAHTTTRPPAAVQTTTARTQNPPNPLPTATQTQSKPDIF
jgi:hypothetical protein